MSQGVSEGSRLARWWVLIVLCSAFAAMAGEAASPEGEWRIVSARIFYEKGGAGAEETGKSSRFLSLARDGTWTFDGAKGRWSVAEVTAADWRRWGVAPYGPGKKIVFDGWAGGQADGPIEERSDRIEFLWVIYRAEPPVTKAPGVVWIKFARR
jgi:hypothetical protein